MKDADAPPEPSPWRLALTSTWLKVRQSRFFQQGIQMVFWRIVAMVISLASSVWVARCLGPEYMGISGIILSVVTALVVVGTLNQDPALIRYYKNRPSVQESEESVAAAFTFRVVSALLMMVPALLILICLRLPPLWMMGLIAAFPLFFFHVNPPDWLLQADGNQPASRRLAAFRTVFAAVLYFGFFRPGTLPGYDILVQALSMAFFFLIGWRIAVGGRKIKLFQLKLLPGMLPIVKSGRWLILGGLVGYAVSVLELPMLGYLGSLKEVGIYRTAVVLVAGVQSFLTMFYDLLYPRLLDWRKLGVDYVWRQQKRIAWTLAVVFAPIALLVFLIIPVFYHLTFGRAFQLAAFPCAILLSAKLIAVIKVVFTSGLLSDHQDHKVVGILLIGAVFGLSLNYVFIPTDGIYAPAITSLMMEILILSLSLLAAWKNVARPRPSSGPA